MYDINNIEFGKRLKELRKEKGMTLDKAQEMIKEVGIPHNFLCDHELNTGYVRLAIANEKYLNR